MAGNMRGPIVKAQELQTNDLIDLEAVLEESGQGNEVTNLMSREFAVVEFISVEDDVFIYIATNQGNVMVDADFTVELY